MNFEKIKKLILFTSTLYGLIIVISMVFTYAKMDTKVELVVDEKEVSKLLDSYSKQAESIKDETCRDTIGDLINFVRENNKSGVRDLVEYYSEILNSKENILIYYSKIKNSCPKLTDKVLENYDLQLLYITSSIQNDEILHKYMFGYELSFKDNSARSVGETSLITIENNIRAKSELAIIKNTIKAVLEGA